ncbi:TetR/AcrR family transcriptional regulator [Asticcacaulis machinosus]|uniref:Helix-turn-helix domain containing protein n=1 Tax=Asticcacaulis machinosus TaxID=2984211 RepID=A0ABT5HIP0_9CAUL|nr:TetR/AcrR family transcriptional regulator [Asticcacaulis machinosus]MDC7676015.1 helix-turn-helix domain containing protein [Asticcacaulis machinosus]
MPLGARARSKELNRQKILAAAKALFRDRGFEAATLRDIAKEAGLSTGALFANFSDKNEIFIKVVEAESAVVLERMIDAHDPALPLAERLLKQLRCTYEAAHTDMQLVMSAFVMNWARKDPAFNQIARLSDLVRQTMLESLQFARDKGDIPVASPIESAAEILEDLCFSNLRRGFHGDMSVEDLISRLKQQIVLIIAGLKAVQA